jgi:gluconokinase
LLADRPEVNLVFLDVSPEVLIQRLGSRPDHFFPDKLLNSQLETLEKPSPTERPHVRVINADGDPNEVAATIVAALWPYGEPGST